MTHLRPARHAVLIVLSGLMLAACGSTSSTPSADERPTPGASSPVPTQPATSSPASIPAVPTYAQLTSRQLIKALPALDDMPAGYTAEQPETKDTSTTFCNYKQPNQENGYASITFDGSSTSAIEAGIRQYGSVADASAQQAALAKALRTCHSMTSDGTTLKVARMSAPSLGDRSIGTALSSQGYTIAELFIQVGPVVIQVGEAGLGSADITKVTAIAKKTIAKYEDAAK